MTCTRQWRVTEHFFALRPRRRCLNLSRASSENCMPSKASCRRTVARRSFGLAAAETGFRLRYGPLG